MLVGSLAPVAPSFAMYAALFTLLQARRLRPGRRAPNPHHGEAPATPSPPPTTDELDARFVYLAVGLVAVVVVGCTTSLGALAFAALAVTTFLVAVTGGYFLILRLARHDDLRGVFQSLVWAPVVLTAGLLSFHVFQLGTDDSMWQPPVVVREPSGWTTVYLLDQSGAKALAMDGDTRTLVFLDPSVVATAQACYEHHGSIGNESQLSRLPSVFQLLGLETHVNQPTCPHEIATLSHRH